jgi:hypothetical protein
MININIHINILRKHSGNTGVFVVEYFQQWFDKYGMNLIAIIDLIDYFRKNATFSLSSINFIWLDDFTNKVARTKTTVLLSFSQTESAFKMKFSNNKQCRISCDLIINAGFMKSKESDNKNIGENICTNSHNFLSEKYTFDNILKLLVYLARSYVNKKL